LMYHFQHKIPIFKIISETEEVNHDFVDIIPPQFISFDFNVDEVSWWIERQKKIKDLKHNAAKLKKPELIKGLPHNHRIAFVFDDCFAEPKKWKDPKINKLFVNGRHFDMLMMYAMQNPKGVPPQCRANSDYCIFFKEKSPGQRKKIYNEYVEGIFKTYKEFNQVFEEMTKDNRCMVVNMNADGKPHECIFHYKARLYPREMGQKIPIQSETMWTVHDHSYDPNGSVRHQNGIVLESSKTPQTPVFYGRSNSSSRRYDSDSSDED